MTEKKAVTEARAAIAAAQARLAEHDAKAAEAAALVAPIEARRIAYEKRVGRRPVVVSTSEGFAYVHNGLAGFSLSWYMGEKKERVLRKEIVEGAHQVQARLSGTQKTTAAWKARGASQRTRFVSPASQRIINRAIARMRRCRQALDEATKAYMTTIATAYEIGDKPTPEEIATAVARMQVLETEQRKYRRVMEDYRREWITRDIERAQVQLERAKELKKEAA